MLDHLSNKYQFSVLKYIQANIEEGIKHNNKSLK